MSRTLGLMPKLIGDAEMRSIAQQIAEVLERHSVPGAASEEIEQILTDKGKGSEP